jgi:hypothetical protein
MRAKGLRTFFRVFSGVNFIALKAGIRIFRLVRELRPLKTAA